MNDVASLAQVSFAAVLMAGIALAVRWLGDAEGGSLADLFRIPLDPPWPRGVQEEAPRPWQVERLSRRGDVVPDRRALEPQVAACACP
jgi:hypothetical protein